MLKTLLRNYNFSNRNIHTSFYKFQSTQIENSVQDGWEEKIKFWLRKYEDLFGITKLSEIHEKVLETQKRIQVVQEMRRKIQEDLFIAQKNLEENRNILHKTSMDDNMYISVVTRVHELLKEQGRLQQSFSLHDQTERELQNTLAVAINNSQDHERTYREKTKYLSLVTGIVGGLLGFLGSSINNWRLRREIKLFASTVSDQVNALQKDIEKLNSSASSNEDASVNADDILSQMKSQQEQFHSNVEAIQSLVSNNILSDTENDYELDLRFKDVSEKLTNDWNSKLNYHTSLNISVISSLLFFGTLVFFMIGSR